MFDVTIIKKWLLEHEAEKRAYDGFWFNFKNYKKEDPLEFNTFFPNFDLNLLEIKINSVAINFSNNYPELDYNHIIITIPIIYKRKDIGYYKLLFNFDGSVDDDYFVMH
ncbi:hypothetical protein [Paenibacillus tyrfis]|uniref:hypothetical protein n=1 Tax=Paenibacillus tyrfis TaxID=1501230 RepID=UPI00117F22FE|nr:hypothetical protein [Paenibacillus tyrfis]